MRCDGGQGTDTVGMMTMWMTSLAWSADATLLIGQVVMPMVFLFALGACVGSLTNVLVYRMPLGLSVVTPPSRCPKCNTRLTWRENIPIFGWVLLGGRCRFCKAKISPEYPLVELLVALVFAGLVYLYYGVNAGTHWLDIDISAIRPAWTREWGSVGLTWPLFAVTLTLVGSLIAMTLVDAKTFTIPMGMALTPAVAGVVVHSGWAVYIGASRGGLPHYLRGGTGNWPWSIPTTMDWWWIGAALGGAIGVGVSLLLLKVGLVGRSFADFEEWEEGSGRRETAGQQTGREEGDGEGKRGRGNGELGTGNGEERAGSGYLIPTSIDAVESTGALRDILTFVVLAVLLGAIGILGVEAGTRWARWVGLLIGIGVAAVVTAVAGRVRDLKNAGPKAAANANANANANAAAGAVADIHIKADAGVYASPGAGAHYAGTGKGETATGGNAIAGAGASPGGDRVSPISGTSDVNINKVLSPSEGGPNQAELWTEYPHARREMVKELAFLGPIAVLGAAGGWIAERIGGVGETAHAPALWVQVLAGVLIGYLVGGGVVWLVRIFGSLAFNKEAMGMGDVHLMAGVGACVGWIDATVAFFLAAFVGVAWTVLAAVRFGTARRAMPYGPFLALATVLVILGKPLIEAGISRLLSAEAPIHLP
ncbi:hypothetical protein BH11PLA1_BH11PLA1_01970 [soil metagenome]